MDTDSDTEFSKGWLEWFLSLKGSEFFCEIDEDYILDRFNLTGLQAEVTYFQKALELITDSLEEYSESQAEEIENSAKHLYGLIHARYIITAAGISKMLEKYKESAFGYCPRVHCNNQPLLPLGITDVPGKYSVFLYCCKCEDVYNPKQNRHRSVDGAYFGTSFPHMFLDTYPYLKPQLSESEMKKFRYEPKMFGFKLHAVSHIHKWQDLKRSEMVARILNDS
ncbi:hypothetical protein BB559_002182 [Furculomyces boomerangus]|uniref:Casein kinase II subunit beta n=2 Tax=Harpellales TaxID=61421 RepID=A0A2T9YXE1_9FUNG|nr:hypothetical protein BB559_002182 [Furculomyces boomerangus]PWA02050.1 hypothetical protein BB558_001823 [Smittium angustum]